MPEVYMMAWTCPAFAGLAPYFYVCVSLPPANKSTAKCCKVALILFLEAAPPKHDPSMLTNLKYAHFQTPVFLHNLVWSMWWV